MLSQDQINSFKTDGHLILPGFVATETIEQWQDQFWGHLGCTIDEPDKWPERVEGFQPNPVFGELPDLQAIVTQVGGGHFSGGGCGVLRAAPKHL